MPDQYSTITSVRNIAEPVYQMAFEEAIVHKKPFDFNLGGARKNDSQKQNIYVLYGEVEFQKRLHLKLRSRSAQSGNNLPNKKSYCFFPSSAKGETMISPLAALLRYAPLSAVCL